MAHSSKRLAPGPASSILPHSPDPATLAPREFFKLFLISRRLQMLLPPGMLFSPLSALKFYSHFRIREALPEPPTPTVKLIQYQQPLPLEH